MMLTAGKIALIGLIVLLLFKAKELPRILTDLGKGIAGLRQGLTGQG